MWVNIPTVPWINAMGTASLSGKRNLIGQGIRFWRRDLGLEMAGKE